MKAGSKTAVQRRRVFYLPGYDPFPARRYRELYRKEARAQAEISGYGIEMLPREDFAEGFGWRVRGRIEGGEAIADFEVLEWSDLVRGSMNRSLPATYAMLLRTAWVYVRSGALARLMRLRKGPVIAALYPVVMLLLQLLVALLVAGGAGLFLGRVISPWLGLPVAALLLVLLLRLFRRLDRHLYAHYLMHDYAYSASRLGAYPPELADQIRLFAGRIEAALDSEVDEVLLVGHSSGAHMAVSVLAEVLRGRGMEAGGGRGDDGPALSLLTLGNVVPMVSFLPRAQALRRDLHDLSRAEGIFWLDVTAPGDGCCFALCDPVAVSGVAPRARRWPLVISAAFSQTLSPERWRRLRWRFFRLHFQYLCAFDRPFDYDYFRITAGPKSLAGRYRGRKPSRSLIDTPLSPHTGMAP